MPESNLIGYTPCHHVAIVSVTGGATDQASKVYFEVELEDGFTKRIYPPEPNGVRIGCVDAGLGMHFAYQWGLFEHPDLPDGIQLRTLTVHYGPMWWQLVEDPCNPNRWLIPGLKSYEGPAEYFEEALKRRLKAFWKVPTVGTSGYETPVQLLVNDQKFDLPSPTARGDAMTKRFDVPGNRGYVFTFEWGKFEHQLLGERKLRQLTVRLAGTEHFWVVVEHPTKSGEWLDELVRTYEIENINFEPTLKRSLSLGA